MSKKWLIGLVLAAVFSMSSWVASASAGKNTAPEEGLVVNGINVPTDGTDSATVAGIPLEEGLWGYEGIWTPYAANPWNTAGTADLYAVVGGVDYNTGIQYAWNDPADAQGFAYPVDSVQLFWDANGSKPKLRWVPSYQLRETHHSNIFTLRLSIYE